jgi:hypothetical protein
MFMWNQDLFKGHWSPTLTGMIKAGDEGFFPSALFSDLHGLPGKLSLQTLNEVFAEELRSRSMDERSLYTGDVSRFLATTKRVASGPKRVQSVSHKTKSKGRVDGSLGTTRKSFDLSTAEKGFARRLSMKKLAPTLISMRKGLSNVVKERDAHMSWMSNGQITESSNGGMGISIRPAELVALSVILGCPLTVGGKDNYTPSEKGALNISMSSSEAEDGKHQIALQRHKRSTTHVPAQGSSFSPLFAKHFASGSLPYALENTTIHGILVSTETLEIAQAGTPLCLREYAVKTPQSRFLASLPNSYEPSFHIVTVSTQGGLANPLVDAVSMLPFVGGLVPLASAPLIKTIRFIASGGLPPLRLLQRLEALVDKVNGHAPGVHVFGPLYDQQNVALLYRERERLGKLATKTYTPDSIADKASRMQRYITLLERLMALVTDIVQEDVLAAVQQATKKELERSYTDAVAAYQVNFLDTASSLSHDHSEPYTGIRSDRSSAASLSTSASPTSTSTGFLPMNLGKQVEQILKAELPLSVEKVAVVARLVIVAWTWSVESVAWAEGEEGFRVPDPATLPEKMIFR